MPSRGHPHDMPLPGRAQSGRPPPGAVLAQRREATKASRSSMRYRIVLRLRRTNRGPSPLARHRSKARGVTPSRSAACSGVAKTAREASGSGSCSASAGTEAESGCRLDVLSIGFPWDEGGSVGRRCGRLAPIGCWRRQTFQKRRERLRAGMDRRSGRLAAADLRCRTGRHAGACEGKACGVEAGLQDEKPPAARRRDQGARLGHLA